jgi:hypothetical protein
VRRWGATLPKTLGGGRGFVRFREANLWVEFDVLRSAYLSPFTLQIRDHMRYRLGENSPAKIFGPSHWATSDLTVFVAMILMT